MRAESGAQWPLSSLRPVSCRSGFPVAVPSFGPAVCPSRRLLAFGQKGHFHSISGRIGNGLENSNMEQWSEETLLRVNMSGGLVDPGSPAGGNVLWPEVNNLKPGRQLCPSPWPLEPGGPQSARPQVCCVHAPSHASPQVPGGQGAGVQGGRRPAAEGCASGLPVPVAHAEGRHQDLPGEGSLEGASVIFCRIRGLSSAFKDTLTQQVKTL